MPRKNASELVQGTLDMLVLKALSWGPRHGYEIMRWIRSTSDDGLRLEEGALYPALHRMRDRGWIEARWGVSENNRRAKFYALTGSGREQLHRQLDAWKRYVSAVSKILGAVA